MLNINLYFLVVIFYIVDWGYKFMFYAVTQFMNPFNLCVDSVSPNSFVIADSNDMSVETISVEKLKSSGMVDMIDGLSKKDKVDAIWHNTLVRLKEAYKNNTLTQEEWNIINGDESIKADVLDPTPLKRIPKNGNHSYYKYDINPYRVMDYSKFGIRIVGQEGRCSRTGSANFLSIGTSVYELGCYNSGLVLHITNGSEQTSIFLSSFINEKYVSGGGTFDYIRRYHDYVLVRWHAYIGIKEPLVRTDMFGTLVFDLQYNFLGLSFEHKLVRDDGFDLPSGTRFPFKLYKNSKQLNTKKLSRHARPEVGTIDTSRVFLNSELSHSISQLKY